MIDIEVLDNEVVPAVLGYLEGGNADVPGLRRKASMLRDAGLIGVEAHRTLVERADALIDWGILVKTSDAGGASGGPFDRGDGQETGPDQVSSLNAGSPAWAEKGLEFPPQDLDPALWSGRNLLDYMNRNHPGKKDVAPPETDMPRSAAGWPQGDPSGAAPAAAPQSQSQPVQQAPRDPAQQVPGQPAAAPGSATVDQDEEQGTPDPEEQFFPTVDNETFSITFTGWELVDMRRTAEAASRDEALMSECAAAWRPGMQRTAALLNLKALGVKWKEEYSPTTPKRDNFFRFVGKDKNKKVYVAQVIGDRPSEFGLYMAAAMEAGSSGHTRYDFETAKDMVEFVRQFWGIGKEMKFKKLKATDFIPRLWDTYMRDPRPELLRFILNSDAAGTEEFITSKFTDQKTPGKVRRAILDAFIDDPNLKGVPQELLNREALPILMQATSEGDAKAAAGLINLPGAKTEVKKFLSDPASPEKGLKALVDAMIESPNASAAPKASEIKDLIRRFAPQELEKMEVPQMFDEEVTVLSRDPKEHKLMERAVGAWSDSTNQFTQRLLEALKAGGGRAAASKWLKQIGAWNPKIEEMIPEQADAAAVQSLMTRFMSTLDVARRYKGKMRPFAHKVKVDYKDGGFFRVFLSVSEMQAPPVPREVLDKLMAHHADDAPLGWAEVHSFAIVPSDGKALRVWAVTEMQSDVEQRTSKLGATEAEQQAQGDRVIVKTPAEWAQYRSVLENWIADWHRILLNTILKRAREYGVQQVWIETSESLAKRWGTWTAAKKSEDGESAALSLYRRVYDVQAQEWGAKTAGPEKVEGMPGNMRGSGFWVIDVAAIPQDKFARSRGLRRLAEGEEQDDELEPELSSRSGWTDDMWQKSVLRYFAYTKKIYDRIKIHDFRAQEVMDIWYMIEVPRAMKFDQQFLEKIVGWLKEAGYDVQVPTQLQDILRQKKREDVADYTQMVENLPMVTEDTVLEMWSRMNAMAEGPEKEKAKKRIEQMRQRLSSASSRGLVVLGRRGTFDYVLNRWTRGQRGSRGRGYTTDGTRLMIHGNMILSGTPNDFMITNAGWDSMMTWSALNTILNDHSAGYHLVKYSGNVFLTHGYLDASKTWTEYLSEKGWEWPGSARFVQGRLEGESKLKPGSEFLAEIRVQNRERNKERREREKTDAFGSARAWDMVMRGIGGDISEREAPILLSVAESFDYEWDEEVHAEYQKVEGDPVKAAAFIFYLVSRLPNNKSSAITRIRSKMHDEGMDRPRGVEGPMEGEGPAHSGRTRKADATDPSDTDTQNDQVGDMMSHLVDPDSLLYRREKGRSELTTNLPAAARGLVRTAEKSTDEVFDVKGLVSDAMDLLRAGPEGSKDYEGDEAGHYSYRMSSLGQNPTNIADTLGVEHGGPGAESDADEFLSEAIEERLGEIADEINKRKYGLSGAFFAEWEDGSLWLSFSWTDEDMETFKQSESGGASRVTHSDSPMEGEARARTPWEIVRSAGGRS